MKRDPYFWYDESKVTDDDLELLFRAVTARTRPFEDELERVLQKHADSLKEKAGAEFGEQWEQWRNDRYRSGELMGRLIERAARHADWLVDRERKRRAKA